MLVASFLMAGSSLVVEYGFYVSGGVETYLHYTQAAALLILFLLQSLTLFTSFDKIRLFAERKPEYLLSGTTLTAALTLLLLTALSDFSIFSTHSQPGYLIASIQCVLVLQIIFIAVRVSRRITRFNIRPAKVLLSSFLFLSLLGAFALLLPKSTTTGLSFVDALFTSTSAVCVTGLIVLDTATGLTFTGQIIVITLIQIGGLGLMTFTTFLVLFSGKLSVHERVMLKDMLSGEYLGEVRSMLKKIIAMTFLIEALGAVFLFFSWPDGMFTTLEERLFSSVFHSISAFCNAGFSLFHDNLYHTGMGMNPAMNISIAALIILGGLGFITLVNLLSLIPGRKPASVGRPRMTTHTRIVLITTAVLITGGAAFIFIADRNAALQGLPWRDQLLASIFQSVTARTAGFNTIDITSLSLPSTLVMILLMFIGASPGSTGGGVKTTTIAVVMLNAIHYIRGQKSLIIGARSITGEITARANAALLFGLLLAFVSTLLVSCFDSFSLLDIIFETISALGTVGLSRGITSSLSDSSKIVLISTMLIGRIGVLTFMQSLTTPATSNRYDYPSEYIIVG